MAVAIDISPVGKGMRSLNQSSNSWVSIIFLPEASAFLLTFNMSLDEYSYRMPIGKP
jgi:hypothetical protein